MKRISILLSAAMMFAVPACSNTGGSGDDGSGTGTGSGSGSGSGSGDEFQQILGSRVTDYNAALRVAALKLTGNLPTTAEINKIASAPDDASKAIAYQAVLTDYMSRPTFANQMYLFWQDTFKTGGTAAFDTAAAFAAELSVNNGAYTDLFTKTSNNCPTLNTATGVFTDAACTNGGEQVGVLSNPGLQQQFFSNFAFRRVRFVQEVFDCLRFPAELSNTPTDVGGSSPYLGVWSFNSISSPTNGGGRVNFQDVSSAICANCHTTINHIAPLFADYDATGTFKGTISVPAAIPGAPLAVLSDYLPAGETTAWRYGKPVTDIAGLGQAMAADPSVAACGVSRIWNWALDKDDIVDALEVVPTDTIQTQLTAFTSGGFKLKDLIYAVYTSPDFVKF